MGSKPCAVMMTTNEKPFAPFGRRVAITDGRDGNAFDIELQYSPVLAFVGIEKEKAATGDERGIDSDADAAGRFEADVQISRANITGVKFKVGAQTYVLHDHLQRTECKFEDGPGVETYPIAHGSQRQS